MFKSDISWIVGFVFLTILLFYLPLDLGGFYPRSRAIIAVLILPFFAIKLIFPSGEQYPRALRNTFIAFFGLLLMSTAVSTDFHNSFIETVYFLLCAMGFVLGYFVIKKKEIFRTINGLFLTNVIIACAFGIFYFVSITRTEPRAYGRFFQADMLAGYLLLFFPMILMLALTIADRKKAALYLIAASLTQAVLFLTFSRGAALSLVCVIPIIIWTLFGKVKPGEAIVRFIIMTVLAVVLISVCIPQAGKNAVKDQLDKRIEETVSSGSADGSAGARKDFYLAALKITASKPVSGTGLGTYGYHYPVFQSRVKYYSRYAHNFYLELLSEAGIPVLLAFLALLFFIGKTIIQRQKNIPDSDLFAKTALAGLSIGLISSLIHIFLDVDFNFSAIGFTFWVIAGLLAGYGQEEPVVPERTVSERLLRMAGATGLCALMFVPFAYNLSFDLQEKGETFYREGNLDKTAVYYNKAVLLDPMDNEGWRKMSDLAIQLKKPEEALAFINKAITLSPFRSRNYETKGRILDILGRYDEAFTCYAKSVELDPINQVYAYQAIGEYYIRKGKFNEAIDTFNKCLSFYKDMDYNDLWHFRAIPLKPQVAAVYLTLGETYIRLNKFDDAISAFENSIKLEKNIPSVFGMGYAFYSKQDYKKAVQLFEEVAASPLSIPETHFYLSDCYLRLGDKQKAEKHSEIFRELKKKQPEKK
ncbi:MAG: O-antigen ligase family protein [Firmicutes bacterium]|nr:O-antigen ligase family protein [Bacillota bacterium]